MKTRVALVGCLLLASAAVPARAADVSAEAPAKADWPTVQHDMERTGYTDVVCKPPYYYRWIWMNGNRIDPEQLKKSSRGVVPFWLLPDFTSARFTSLQQPMAKGGVVYIGSVDGGLYAIDLQTGETKWKGETSGQVLHCVSVTDDGVFVPAARGVDAFALDGKKLWSFECPRGGSFFACPAVTRSKVLVGATSGFFYGIDVKSGKAAWEFDAGAPIYQTPAAHENAVYFGAEDMHAYSLNIDTGKVNWKSGQFPGVTFGHYWPVVAAKRGAVLFRTMPLHMLWATPIEKAPFDNEKAQEALREAMKNNPSARSLYVLNLADGKEKVFVASGHFGFHADISPPPIVRWTDGEVFSWYYAKNGAFQKAGQWGGWGNTTDFGIIDFQTGFFKMIAPTGTYGPPAIVRYDDHHANTMGDGYLSGLQAGLGGGLACIDGKGPGWGLSTMQGQFSAAGKAGVVGGGRHWGGAVSFTLLDDTILVNAMAGPCIVAIGHVDK